MKSLAELRAEQERLAERLRQLADKSELLRDTLADAEMKRLADRAGGLGKEQQSLMQGPFDKKAADKLQGEMKKLTEDTLRLAQQGGGPEAKAAAGAAAEAQKAMEKAVSDKASGKTAEAKAAQADVALKLQMTQKGLEASAAKMPGPGEEKAKTAEALAQGQKLVQMAAQKLQTQPAAAPKAMRQAAGALDKAAQQMSRQMGQLLPKTAGRPAVGAGGIGKAGKLALPPALAKKLEPFAGKSWGELPGELKTQLLQDARACFGDDYAPIIQQYFEQIAGAPAPPPPAPAKQP
jgi:hypothetical protein